MKVIAYLIYGDKKEYQLELYFSVLSALRLLNDNPDKVIISIVSDQKDFNFNLPVDHIKFTPSEFAEWTQNGDYNHRAKICALIKALDYYQAPVIMIDTDTYFIDNPNKLFERVSPQKSVMHCFENYVIGDQPFWRPMIEKIGDGIEIEGVNISAQSPMFNSGVIGVDFANRTLLEKTLILMDELYSKVSIFNIEQFSLGVVLSKYTDLLFSDDIVEHYYGVKKYFIHIEVSRLIENLKTASLATIIEASNTLELNFPRKSLRDKIITQLLSSIKHWNKDYQFAYLAYRSSFYYVSKDPDYANAWAKVTLQMAKVLVNELVDNKQDPAFLLSNMQHDFRKFRKDTIETLAWIDSDVKSSWIQFWCQ